MAIHLDSLRSQARDLPEQPGVYFWLDGRGKVLYIGKAVDLRARVTSYFSNARRDRRTRELLERARSIRFEVVSTELQALLRESALIKQEQPQFNRALRTSRRPYYLKLDGHVEHPYLETSRQMDDDQSLYFGPFRTAAVMRETMAFVHDVLPLRKCTARNPRCRPCMYFQMHKCAAPLLDEQHHRAHQEAINQLFELLDGRSDRVAEWLEAKRDRLSESLLFERAAEVQDRLNALAALLKRQTILEAAIRCRCVLIHQDAAPRNAERLLLIAHGHVVSVIDVAGSSPESVLRWIRAHDILIRSLRREQSEIDAAEVMARWLSANRETVRWVAIPENAGDGDVRDRIAYVLKALAGSGSAAAH